MRDPHGFRPLTLGRLGDAYIVCSETCALDLIDAEWVRDIEPGEVFIVGPDGDEVDPSVPAGAVGALHLRARLLRAARFVRVRRERQRGAHGARPPARRASSRPTPTSSCRFPTRASARRPGYRRGVGPAAADGPDPQSLRRPDVHRAAPVDPALRRAREAQPGARASCRAGASCSSTTRSCAARRAARSCKMVRAAGASEVHMRISCPPTISPCFYGVDTPQRSELIAATHSLEEIRRYIGADSLGYLSLDGLLAAVGPTRQSYCTSCYTGQYPVAFPRNEAAYLQLALKLDRMMRDVLARRVRRLPCVPAVAPLAQHAGARRRRRRPPAARRRRGRHGGDRPARLVRLRRRGRRRRGRSGARRADVAVPPLAQAVARAHGRVRALPRAGAARRLRRTDARRDVMRELQADRNDRLRTVAFAWFEHHPDPDVAAGADRRRSTKERSEFVRPALTRALAAHGSRSARAAPCSCRSSLRGEDFFRGAVIEALGDYDGTLRARRDRRGRQARRPAAGRRDHGAREDRRRVACARCWRRCRRSAPRERAADDLGGALPAGHRLRGARRRISRRRSTFA